MSKSPISLRRRDKSNNASIASSKDASRDLSGLRSPMSANRSRGSFIFSKNPSSSKPGNVKVLCRVRPLNKKELEAKEMTCVEIDDDKTLTLKMSQSTDAGSNVRKLSFEKVFGKESSQEEVYEATAKPIVESVLEGYNGTILAYGQTSSGKTYTMQGPNIENPEFCGIISRMAQQVFEKIKNIHENTEFTIKFSAIEIHNEKIKDLFKPEKPSLNIRQDKLKGILIEDLTEAQVSNEEEIIKHIKTINSFKSKSKEISNRAHTIYMTTIYQKNLTDLSAKVGKLYLVDLAGFEKNSKSKDEKITKEAKTVNQSLTTLGKVIHMLGSSNNKHIPYRDSVLTRILQDSLGGNSKTVLITTISPSSIYEQETYETLKFGYRAMKIHNIPKINQELTFPQLQKMYAKLEKENSDKDKKIEDLVKLLMEQGIFLDPDHKIEAGNILDSKSDILKDINLASIGGEMETQGDLPVFEKDENFLNKSIASFSDIEHDDNLLPVQDFDELLEEERSKLRTEMDKVEKLMQELSIANEKLLKAEKENKALIYQNCMLNLKMDTLTDSLSEKEENIMTIENLLDKYITENKELKRKNDSHLLKLKDNEIAIDRLSATSVIGHSNDKNILELNQKNNSIIQAKSFIEHFIQGITNKYRDLDWKELEQISANYIEDLKRILDLQDKSIQNKEEEINLLKQDNTKLEEELTKEKENCSNLEKELNRLAEDFNNLANEQVIDFEEIVEEMINAALIRQKAFYEKKEFATLRDLQERMNKICKLEEELSNEKSNKENLNTNLNHEQSRDEAIQTDLSDEKLNKKALLKQAINDMTRQLQHLKPKQDSSRISNDTSHSNKEDKMKMGSSLRKSRKDEALMDLSQSVNLAVKQNFEKARQDVEVYKKGMWHQEGSTNNMSSSVRLGRRQNREEQENNEKTE